MIKIDLHTHSNQSDGTLSPEELIDCAWQHNVKCIALCDHDTTAGIDRFKKAGHIRGLTAIGGIELSVTCSTGTCHIVGLHVDPSNDELQTILTEFRDARHARVVAIISKLNSFGIGINTETVQKLCPGEVIGRPHIAQALVNDGVVVSVQEAFEKFLRKGAKAYVPRSHLDPITAVRTLKKASAVTVLAHPVQMNISDEEMVDFVESMKGCGLDAIEVYTPHHNVERIEAYIRIAQKTGVGISGGSDFHGSLKPERLPGMYAPGKPIPLSVGNIIGY